MLHNFIHHVYDLQLAMVSKSEYLNRLVFGKRSHPGEKLKIVLNDLPGGTKTFELVVNFCYGLNIDATPTNIAPLYCAANFLEMSDDLQQGNLIPKTEAFLSFAIFSSWKDNFQILKSCELVPPWAKELLIVQRCSDAIAWKASIDPEAFVHTESAENWWFHDVSTLRIDHFMQVIESIKREGMKSELVGSCIAHWTTKWFSRIKSGFDNLITVPKHLTQKLQRVTIESLIKMLPVEENSVSCNFLLHLLKFGLAIQINSDMLSKLDRRIASMLEQCSVQDLMVKNNVGDKGTTYDVGIVSKVVETYVLLALKNSGQRVSIVGRLMDDYLTLIARDINLDVNDFKSLVDALPTNARSCDDKLYRAMDMYLQVLIIIEVIFYTCKHHYKRRNLF